MAAAGAGEAGGAMSPPVSPRANLDVKLLRAAAGRGKTVGACLQFMIHVRMFEFSSLQQKWCFLTKLFLTCPDGTDN
jgi:hypothetical protein